MPRTSKGTKKSAKLFHSEAANRVVPEADNQKEELLEQAEKAYSAVQSVFPRCQRRHDELLEKVRTRTGWVNDFLSYLVTHHSVHHYVYEYLEECGAVDSVLKADHQTATSPEVASYVARIPGRSFHGYVLGPATFISCLQRRLSALDSIFQDVFSDDPGQSEVKVPPPNIRIVNDSTAGVCSLPDDLGFMVEFWYVFHVLQCIVDTIATHVPESRAALQEIASLDMIEILEMYCSCYNGDLLLLKSEEGGEHTDLKEFSVASSDLFSASEFLPFFDDAYTILAQFFLIVDMCVGKEMSSSAVSRSSDEWKSVVLEAKRMFSTSFYKCDVNEFRRRVVKPAPLQGPDMRKQNTRHRSKASKPTSHVRTQYICSSLLLENFDKLHNLVMCWKDFVSNCVTTGIWDTQHMREQRCAHRLEMIVSAILVAALNRIIILCDLGYCKLSPNSMRRLFRTDSQRLYQNQIRLHSFPDVNLHQKSIDRGEGIAYPEAISECVMSECIIPLREERESLFRMLCEDKSMTSDDLLSLQTTVEQLKEVTTVPATPLTLQNLTTEEGFSQVRAESRFSFASSCSSADAVASSIVHEDVEVEQHHDQMADKPSTDTTHSTLDKEAEAAADELSKCKVNAEQSTSSFRERLKKFLTRE